MKSLLSLLSETQLDANLLNEAERFSVHRLTLQKKRMIREVFTEFHHDIMMLDRKYFENVEGLRIELGAGVCPIRDTYPDVLATDVVSDPSFDLVLDALSMDLADGSVRALYGQNCFHHFSKAELFFQEVVRVIAPGGGVILVEPYYGPFARLIFTRLFETESFDMGAEEWENVAEGPMVGANQALSFIVFVRDRRLFEQRFPQLEIIYNAPFHNYLRYLLSGGVNFKQIIPDALIGMVKLFEKLLRPISSYLALHHVIVVKRRHSI